MMKSVKPLYRELRGKGIKRQANAADDGKSSQGPSPFKKEGDSKPIVPKVGGSGAPGGHAQEKPNSCTRKERG